MTPKYIEDLLSSSQNAECLTESTLQLTSPPQQLVDVISNILWNIQLLNVKYSYYIHYDSEPQHQSNHIQLDFSGIRHLKDFKFDVSNLEL
jgi:hypothetical protein